MILEISMCSGDPKTGHILFYLFYLLGVNKTENSLTDEMMRSGSNKMVEKVFVLHIL